jgi:hypothetical protein
MRALLSASSAPLPAAAKTGPRRAQDFYPIILANEPGDRGVSSLNLPNSEFKIGSLNLRRRGLRKGDSLLKVLIPAEFFSANVSRTDVPIGPCSISSASCALAPRTARG